MQFKGLRYSAHADSTFIDTVKTRVNDYFEKKNISKFANTEMVVKTIFMLALYFIPFALMLTVFQSNAIGAYSMWLLMGFGMAGIGLSVMHDANHNAYSKHKRVNEIVGYVVNLVGGSSINWKIQHNVLHHSFTNVEGMDEDLDPAGLMRFSPHGKWYAFHKYQHIYAWFLYCLLTFNWSFIKDYKQLIRYNRMGLVKSFGKKFTERLVRLVAAKLFFYAMIIAVPVMVMEAPLWQTILGLVSMYAISGFILATIFQPAHVMPSSEYPLPDLNGKLDNNWAIHQMLTTANFSPNSRFFSWYVGGLNYQIEHHLFPNICHIHYREISKIVKQTAQEFGVPYNSQKTWVEAVFLHGKMLKALGDKNFVPAQAVAA